MYTAYYCYDALCGWCFGFSPVVKKLVDQYKDKIFFEVLSGGMIPKESARPIGVTAKYILQEYPRVEEMSGVRFGEDFLWHLKNPEQSDWHLHSEKPAIALCIFKEKFPEQQVQFAADLQNALHVEGRDLTDDEAYRHLLKKYTMNADDFYKKLHSETYIKKAHYEFALCQQLQVTGFPALLLQTAESKFYLLARGYTSFDNVKASIENILTEVNAG